MKKLIMILMVIIIRVLLLSSNRTILIRNVTTFIGKTLSHIIRHARMSFDNYDVGTIAQQLYVVYSNSVIYKYFLPFA